MGEADRVLKCLTVGTDDITNATYSSTTTSPNLHAIPGYSNPNLISLDLFHRLHRYFGYPATECSKSLQRCNCCADMFLF